MRWGGPPQVRRRARRCTFRTSPSGPTFVGFALHASGVVSREIMASNHLYARPQQYLSGASLSVRPSDILPFPAGALLSAPFSPPPLLRQATRGFSWLLLAPLCARDRPGRVPRSLLSSFSGRAAPTSIAGRVSHSPRSMNPVFSIAAFVAMSVANSLSPACTAFHKTAQLLQTVFSLDGIVSRKLARMNSPAPVEINTLSCFRKRRARAIGYHLFHGPT